MNRPGWAKEERERQERLERRQRAPIAPLSEDPDLLRPVSETIRLLREQQTRGYIIDIETGEIWPK